MSGDVYCLLYEQAVVVVCTGDDLCVFLQVFVCGSVFVFLKPVLNGARALLQVHGQVHGSTFVRFSIVLKMFVCNTIETR